jgi:predicted RecA/RadA family phage recombinase
MATNKSLERATAVTLAVPSTVKSGDLILVGVMAGIALTDYNASTGNATVDFDGAFLLSVTAKTSLSPSTGSQVKPGDALYLDGGSQDSTTNVTTGGTVDKNSSSGVYIGNALDGISSAATATIRVKLPGAKAA